MKAKYKTDIVEAIQFTGDNVRELTEFCEKHEFDGSFYEKYTSFDGTEQGPDFEVYAKNITCSLLVNDWIVASNGIAMAFSNDEFDTLFESI